MFLYFYKGSDPEAIASWVRGDNFWQACLGAGYRRDWGCNEEAVVIKLAVPCRDGFVLVQTARFKETNIANKDVVSVMTLLRQSSIDLQLRLLRPPHLIFRESRSCFPLIDSAGYVTL